MLLLASSPVRADEWLELRTPNFTVLSEASESRTRAWAAEFELFRRAMNLVMPVAQDAIEPVSVFLFRSDRRMRPFKPREAGKPSNVSGFFARANGCNIIALAVDGARDDIRETIYHEAVHWHLQAANRPCPAWLEEGLAEVMGNFRLDGANFVIGARRPEYYRILRITGALPFAQLAGMSTLAFNGKHAALTERFYAQSWMLTHALIFGVEGVGLARLGDYLAAGVVSLDPNADLQTKLGIAAPALEGLLANYLARGRYATLKLPFSRADVDKDFVLRRPSAGELELAHCNLLLGAGQLQEAETRLLQLRVARMADPQPLEALAWIGLARENLPEAGERFREAFRIGGGGALGNYVLGALELTEAARSPFGPSEKQVDAGLQRLEAAVKAKPRLQIVYETLALFSVGMKDHGSRVIPLLEEGARRFPENARILAGLAVHLSRAGAAERTCELVANVRRRDAHGDKVLLPLVQAAEAELARARETRLPGLLTPRRE